ncbi:MAG: hypothetical protein WD595_04740 [Waddliaceae bacterium]
MSINSTWNDLSPYAIPPIAASISIIPVFPGFIAKTAQQLGQPVPKMTVMKALKSGIKSAPIAGVVTGTQMVAQNLAEKALTKISGESDKPNVALMSISSLMVGVISAPPLSVLNGHSMGYTAAQSLKKLSMKQTSVITAREGCFLLSLRASDPINEQMKETLGNSALVKLGCAFFSGAIGSILSHPCDTTLTLWQRGVKIESYHQLMRGAPMKALTIGSFCLLYNSTKDFLDRIDGYSKV